jgi:hypothetical protein
MQRIIRSAYLDAQLPVPRHGQIALRGEMALAVGLQVVGLSAHIHIEHGGIDRDAYIRINLARRAIAHGNGKDVGAEGIRIDVQIDTIFVIGGAGWSVPAKTFSRPVQSRTPTPSSGSQRKVLVSLLVCLDTCASNCFTSSVR